MMSLLYALATTSPTRPCRCSGERSALSFTTLVVLALESGLKHRSDHRVIVFAMELVGQVKVPPSCCAWSGRAISVRQLKQFMFTNTYPLKGA